MVIGNTFLPGVFDAIQPALESLSWLHRIWVKFVDCSGTYICTPVKKQQSRFCGLVRSHPLGYRRCRETAVRCVHLDKGTYHLFPCHAGLFVLAVPLQGDAGSFGALATGEVITPSCSTTQVLEKLQDLGLNQELLRQFYQEIPVKSHEEIRMLGEALYALDNIGFRHFKPSTGDGLKDARQLARDAVEYIATNYHQPLTLEGVAQMVHISPSYFSHIFKEEQKQTFTSYLTEARINKAKDLLKGSDLSISVIAGTVGYEDANYFSRVFKKNVGMSPLAFKKRFNKSKC
jgi:AraC-like DNA-binding protein/ligand-binding sensor protein